MEQKTVTSNQIQKRKGQTLAEFALTLPILLMLTFGIVEFGRLFQSWVSIQNAAREASRYTTTGQYDDDKYALEIYDPISDTITVPGILPCRGNDRPTDLGTLATRKMNPESPDVQFYALTHDPPVTYAPESLFATWYDGINCDPGNADHFEWRKDVARILSIMDVARQGAGGLSLAPNWRKGGGDMGDVEQMMFDLWTLPRTGSNDQRYFNVVVCSSRAFINSESIPIDVTDGENVGGVLVTQKDAPRTRFITVFDETTLASAGVPSQYLFDVPMPYCLLNEKQPEDIRETTNFGLPWLDPGGPGDRVSVFVTYNHPLVTPLGLADFVRMEARRSGVNEAFRASRALNAVEGSPPGLGAIDTPTPLPATLTFTPSPTNSETPTLTYTPTHTPTATPSPFECSELNISQLFFFQSRVFMDIENRNYQDSNLDRVELNWSIPSDSPYASSMYLQSEAINSEIFWYGEQYASPFDTATLTGSQLTYFNNADRSIPGTNIGEIPISQWEANYLGAGFNINTFMEPWRFNGTKLYFHNPNPAGPAQCVIEWLVDEPDPDEPPTEPPPGSTNTFTPDCASSSVRVEFVDFKSFGVVQLRVTNNRYQPTPLLDFTIAWPDPSDTDTFGTDLTGILTLRKISVGGNNADDFGLPDSTGTLVWRGREDWGDSGSRGDRTPNTSPGDPDESFWRNNYVFPPRSITNLWIDFDGTSGALDDNFGIGAWMFNGTYFNLGCSGGGPGNGGGGGGADGDIFLDNIPVPPPTRTPRASNTPGPTFTPSPTRPSATPSNTPTPGPSKTPTNTPTITNTAPPQPPTAPPTQDGSGSEV